MVHLLDGFVRGLVWSHLVILAQLGLGDGERGQHLLDQAGEVLARIPAHHHISRTTTRQTLGFDVETVSESGFMLGAPFSIQAFLLSESSVALPYPHAPPSPLLHGVAQNGEAQVQGHVGQAVLDHRPPHLLQVRV